VREYLTNNPGSFHLHPTENGKSPISYNLAMTTSFMAICPRKNEGEMMRRDDGSEIGFVALNGTLLAGTLMVKGEEEWDALRANKLTLDRLLSSVGIPSHGCDTRL
jgi:sulfate adenylyltransferase (ADP) / ATP adenylyltransferase